MRIKLYSSLRPETKPLLLSPHQLSIPSQSTLSDIIITTASPKLNIKSFLVALTLWIVNAIDALQIFALGFLIAALRIDVDKQPIPTPEWLFPKGTIFTISQSATAVLSSTVYICMLIGGISSTPIESRIGSRRALLTACVVCLLSFIASSQAPNYFILLLFQAIIGLSIGIRAPICYSNLAALFPQKNANGFVISTAAFVWVLGSMYASLTGWITIGNILALSWRNYMLILAIPLFLVLIGGIFLLYEPVHSGRKILGSLQPALDLIKLQNGKIHQFNNFDLIVYNQYGSTNNHYDSDNINHYDSQNSQRNNQNHQKSIRFGRLLRENIDQVINDASDLSTSTDNLGYYNTNYDDTDNNYDDINIWSVDVDNETDISLLYYVLDAHWTNIPNQMIINYAKYDEDDNITHSDNNTNNDEANSLHNNHDESSPFVQVEQNNQFRQDTNVELSNNNKDEEARLLLSDSTAHNHSQSDMSTSFQSEKQSLQSLQLHQQQQQQQQQFPSFKILLIMLTLIWFIISFSSSGFSSFLPTLWKKIIPEEHQDDTNIDYIVSFIYSAVQLPAGIMNVIIITRVFPPKILFYSIILCFVSTFCLSFSFHYAAGASSDATKSSFLNVYLPIIFVLTTQFGMSTIWCVINYVGLQYFNDDKKVFAYAIQSSIGGKLGSFISQYAFAYLVDYSPFLLLLIVSTLNFICIFVSLWVYKAVNINNNDTVAQNNNIVNNNDIE